MIIYGPGSKANKSEWRSQMPGNQTTQTNRAQHLVIQCDHIEIPLIFIKVP